MARITCNCVGVSLTIGCDFPCMAVTLRSAIRMRGDGENKMVANRLDVLNAHNVSCSSAMNDDRHGRNSDTYSNIHFIQQRKVGVTFRL